MSKDSQRRLEENPLRVLDSKEKEDKVAVENAPSILDFLMKKAKLTLMLCVRCWKIWGRLYHRYQYGAWLDYYNHTIFEFITEIEGNDLTVCAGGRYDGLVAYFGGPETAGFGFGLGVERLLLILEKQGVALPIENALDVYIAVLGEGANVKALNWYKLFANKVSKQSVITSTANSKLSSSQPMSLRLRLSSL